MRESSPLWIVGDVQGFLDPFRHVLRGAGLLNATDHWCGGGATLAVLGDLVDRGPDGIGVIELLMRIQMEAAQAGGAVELVIGNHDVLIMGARTFGGGFREAWRLSGGIDSDMERLTDQHVAWLKAMPAMRLTRDVLIMHADAMFYMDYGTNIGEVNAGFAQVLCGDDPNAWDRLLRAFTEHRAFLGAEGCARAEAMLSTFAGNKLVHGHTPIPRVTHQPSAEVSTAYEYCAGRCVNVDPGIYLGGPGFAYKVSA